MNIAVVSGGSKGIGLAIATELDKLMLDEIWIISRTFDKNELFKTKIRHFPLDISKSDFSESLKNFSNMEQFPFCMFQLLTDKFILPLFFNFIDLTLSHQACISEQWCAKAS